MNRKRPRKAIPPQICSTSRGAKSNVEDGPQILGDGRVTEDALRRIIERTDLQLASTVIVPSYDGDGSTIAVPTLAYMKVSLEAAIGWYDLERRSSLDPSPSKLSQRLVAIAAAATRLADLLPAVDQHDDESLSHLEKHTAWKLRQQAQLMGEAMDRASGKGFRHYPPTPWSMTDNTYVDYHGRSQLRDIVEGTRQVNAWASRAVSIVKARIKPNRRDRHQGDSALNQYIGS